MTNVRHILNILEQKSYISSRWIYGSLLLANMRRILNIFKLGLNIL